MGRNRVNYGGRAFKQDASNAMKGDIVRALVELITNADDAYGENQSGKIRIEVEHRRSQPWRVVVRDRAKGMRKDKMQRALGGLGEQTSGFQERRVRGNLGRGAKDVAAFGNVSFESICDGYYTKMVLEDDGSFDDILERKAKDNDRDDLGIARGNGLVVSIEVASNFRCPQHRTMLEKLARHYQLRDINTDPRRELSLVDLNTATSDGIRYGRPSLPVVLESEISIDGYDAVTATLVLYKNEERYENASTDTGRPEGLLLKGRRAIYENTLFSYEGNPYAHWFSGSVKCDYVDQLAMDFDRRSMSGETIDPSNPMPIISRSRDGLEHDHPFYKALSDAIETAIKPFVDAEEANARSGAARESARMRRTLDALGRDLGKLLDSDLREIDEDGLTGDSAGEADVPVRLVPQSPVLYINEVKTVSVIVQRALGVDKVELDLDPEGVVELVDGPTVELSDHPRRDDLLIGRIRLRPLVEDEETYLTVRCGESETMALVEVRKEREEPEPSPPESFQFERERYQLAHGKRRAIRLMAPVDVVDAEGHEVTVVSSSQDVVVFGGKCELVFDEDLICYVGTIDVDPRALGARGTLTARLGSATAEAEVIVAQNEGSGPAIQIRIDDEDGGKYRALVERVGDRTVIKILGGHPAIKRYLGPGPQFPRQESLEARVMIAEIIAGEASRMVMEKKYRAGGELDGPAFYAEHMNYMAKYLSRCHKMMVLDAELP